MNLYIAKILYKIGILKKLRVNVPIYVNGMKMSIPMINGVGYDNLYMSELWMCDLLKKILPLKQGIFIDVGVNVGQTLIKLRSLNSEMEYVGFEPNPHCVYYSDALVKENGFGGCRLIPAGLMDRDTILELNLYTGGGTDSSASVIADFRPDKVYRKIFVPVYRFEHISHELKIQKPAIIKIDVEGAELEVLQSLFDVIMRERPLVLLEILPCYTEKNIERISRQEQLEALLKKASYRILRVIKSSDSHTVKQLLELTTIGIHDNAEWCEYLLLPNEISTSSIVL